jgi:predicted ATPase/DNA-binding CsgD family transcriptional regulator
VAQKDITMLPAEVTTFVGRRQELSEIQKLLGTCRLVTLTGTGGVGKTRLAMRVAANVQRSFLGGIFVCQLADLNDPDLLGQVVASSVGVRDRGGDALVTMSNYLEDKKALLVVDNCEALRTACGHLLGELLRSCPRLRVLATSREVLRVPGEQVFVVPPLSIPDADQRLALTGLESYEAVNLFVDRAKAILPGFALTPENSSSVAQLCKALDGLPLSIELAAARLPVLSPKQMIGRLEDRFRLLTTGNPWAPPRQRTLSALVRWSFDLCSANEQLLWARMSVFPGRFDLPAVEAVCSGDGLSQRQVFDAVAGLVDKCILVRDEIASEAHYWMLETIRQYGRSRLTAEEMRALRRRHRDWYFYVGSTAKREWFGPDQVEWLARLHSDQPNLRAALEFSFSEPGEARTGVELASRLWFYWIATGYFSEGQRWLDRGLELGQYDCATRATALWVAAWLAALQGAFQTAAARLDEARPLATDCADSTILTYITDTAAVSALLEGDVDRARARFDEVLDRHRCAADPAGLVCALNMLTGLAALQGDFPAATAYNKECLSLCDAHGERWYKSYALCHLGVALWQQGAVRKADAAVRESLRLNRPFNQRLGIGMDLEVLAWIAVADGHYQRAARLFGALREIWRALDVPASGLGYLGGDHETCLAQARQKLGARTFDDLHHSGSTLSLDAVIAFALDETPTSPSAETGPESLTPREQQVAELVAAGKTNKEIASSLVISRRTAEAHVENILVKLGFTNRAQVATWVAQPRATTSTSEIAEPS